MGDNRILQPKPVTRRITDADHSVHHHASANLATTRGKVSVACRVCQAKRTKVSSARYIYMETTSCLFLLRLTRQVFP